MRKSIKDADWKKIRDIDALFFVAETKSIFPF